MILLYDHWHQKIIIIRLQSSLKMTVRGPIVDIMIIVGLS
jgi:hypothetical protein